MHGSSKLLENFELQNIHKSPTTAQNELMISVFAGEPSGLNEKNKNEPTKATDNLNTCLPNSPLKILYELVFKGS